MTDVAGAAPDAAPPDWVRSVGDRLRELAQHRWLEHHAGQLCRLADDLTVADHAAYWAELELSSLFKADERALSEEPTTAGIRRADVARAVLIFVPLLVTWLGIALASRAYSAALAVEPSLASRSFIALWEGGFGGRGGWSIPLSAVALIDVVAIFSLIVTSAYLQVEQTRAENRQVDTFHALRDKLSATLLDASLWLVQFKYSTPARFQTELTGAAVAMQDLVKSMDSSIAATGHAAMVVGESAGEVQIAAGSLAGVVAGVSTTSGKLSDSVESTLAPISDLTRVVGALEVAATGQQVALNGLAVALTEALSGMVGVTQGAHEQAVVLASQLEQSATVHEQYLGRLSVAQEQQQGVADSIAQAAESTAGLHEQLSALTTTTTASAKQALEASRFLMAELQASADGVVGLAESQRQFAELLRSTNASVEVGVARLRDDLEQLHVVLNWLTELGTPR